MVSPTPGVMHNVFFTADTHFGHQYMLEFRPFRHVDEMDEALIARWNERIKGKDLVYHLGDFSFRNNRETANILRRLNGRIFLIKGNHDRLSAANRGSFEDVRDYYEVKAIGNTKLKPGIVLCHYPFVTWKKAHYGASHCHGHSHSNLRTTRNIRRLDVGVDTHDLYPYSYEEVREIMEKRGIDAVDHHEPRGRRA